MPPLLADVAPLSPEFQIGLFSVLGLLLAILAIMAHLRRKPTLDAELVKFQIAIESLQGTVQQLNAAIGRHAGHESEIKTLKEKVTLLETRRETDLHAQRTYTRETTREIFEKLDAVNVAFGQNVRLFERAMGNIEGELKACTQRLANLESK